MTPTGLQQAISRAAQLRDAAIASASKSAPDYATYDAATSKAIRDYQRTVTRAYRRLAFAEPIQ